MATQVFIKAGPDHEEESTYHLCQKVAWDTFSCPFDSWRFTFYSSILLLLSFPFNCNEVQNICLCVLNNNNKKKTFNFFFCQIFLHEKRLLFRFLFRSHWSIKESRISEKLFNINKCSKSLQACFRKVARWLIVQQPQSNSLPALTRRYIKVPLAFIKWKFSLDEGKGNLPSWHVV